MTNILEYVRNLFKKEKHTPKPTYIILVDGYGNYTVKYNPVVEWEDAWYITLYTDLTSMEQAEREIAKHKEWLIKRVSKTVKEID